MYASTTLMHPEVRRASTKLASANVLFHFDALTTAFVELLLLRLSSPLWLLFFPFSLFPLFTSLCNLEFSHQNKLLQLCKLFAFVQHAICNLGLETCYNSKNLPKQSVDFRNKECKIATLAILYISSATSSSTLEALKWQHE